MCRPENIMLQDHFIMLCSHFVYIMFSIFSIMLVIILAHGARLATILAVMNN